MKIAITGRIGSGKSTVAEKMAKALNCQIVDADFVSRAVTAKSGVAMPAIAKSFGEEFILDDGSMNREKMREFVFSNPEKKRLLEDTLSFYIKNGKLAVFKIIR